MTLALDGLRKRFGDVQALDGVTFEVEPGEVFGFLGANGAGKTTTMRIVLGLLRADAAPSPGRAGRPATGRAGRGATCPRSAASTCACRSSSSSCSSPRSTACRRRKARARRARPGWPGSGSPTTPTGRPRPCRRATSRRSSTSRPCCTTRTSCSWTSRSRARPGQRRAAQVSVPRDARPRQDDRLQHPPARPGRGAVRLGGDHRPRPDRHGGPDA